MDLFPDEPELWPENFAYRTAWMALHDLRPDGFNRIVAITPELIESWARYFWCLDVRTLVRRVIAVDSGFRALQRRLQAEAEAEKPVPKGKK